MWTLAVLLVVLRVLRTCRVEPMYITIKITDLTDDTSVVLALAFRLNPSFPCVAKLIRNPR